MEYRTIHSDLCATEFEGVLDGAWQCRQGKNLPLTDAGHDGDAQHQHCAHDEHRSDAAGERHRKKHE